MHLRLNFMDELTIGLLYKILNRLIINIWFAWNYTMIPLLCNWRNVPWWDKIQSTSTFTAETSLDVWHELPPDVLEAVDAEGGVPAGLAGDVPLAGVGRAEHREHHVVLRRHAQVGRQVWPGLANIGSLKQTSLLITSGIRMGDFCVIRWLDYLDQWVISPILSQTLYWYFCVTVVIAVVMTDPDQLAVVGRGRGVTHLAGQEVGETLGCKPVNVINWVSFPCQRVDKHPCSSGDSSLCNLVNGFNLTILYFSV